jgi:hypothetical protein
MRKLIYIPIVHTAADMGSLLPAAKAEFLRRYGEQEWDDHNAVIGGFWEGLRERIAGLHLEYARTYLYQDGLPVCGKESEIVTDLARQGSQNHALLLWLVSEGATLVGTEAPEVLLEEHELVRGVLTAPEGEKRQAALEAYKTKGKELLARRDEYIRHRVNATLSDNCTGLLFIGLMHRVDETLPKDVSVSYLIHRLPFRRAADINRLGGEEET